MKKVAEDGAECVTLIGQTKSGELRVEIYSQAGKVRHFDLAHFTDAIERTYLPPRRAMTFYASLRCKCRLTTRYELWKSRGSREFRSADTLR